MPSQRDGRIAGPAVVPSIHRSKARSAEDRGSAGKRGRIDFGARGIQAGGSSPPWPVGDSTGPHGRFGAAPRFSGRLHAGLNDPEDVQERPKSLIGIAGLAELAGQFLHVMPPFQVAASIHEVPFIAIRSGWVGRLIL